MHSMQMIDLRSDTVTQPTADMLHAMAAAKLGDDVFREDPSVIELERLAADLIGKAEALFVASGTMGNLVSLMTHAQPGNEVILERSSHISIGEGGGITRIAGLMPRLYDASDGTVPVERIRRLIQRSGAHFEGQTKLICLENTHNALGGVPVSVEETERLGALVAEYGLKLHIDGARLFNAAEVLGVSAADLAAPADSVMFCLSKGLCAPVGSIIAGSGDFISRARRNRRLLGGGMRQAGVLAAAGIVALRDMVHRLSEDHLAAAYLASALNSVPGIHVESVTQRTNMVYVDCRELGCPAAELARLLSAKDVRLLALGVHRLRMVTHYGISAADADRVCQAFRDAVQFVQTNAQAE